MLRHGYPDSYADQISVYIILIVWEEWVELVRLEYMGLMCRIIGMRI